ncbi:MAG: proline dehydrogenase family protein [Candidatus Micrarchaeaceae archaeon]
MDLNRVFERVFASRWIAGADIGDAVRVAKKFNSKGISAAINYLGESLDSEDEVSKAVGVYSRLIIELKRISLHSDISVKPSQLGLAISTRLAASNYARIVSLARKNGLFVWLDMEEHNFVDDTIRLYRRQMRRGMVGICIQAYLRRSKGDLESLSEDGAVIRLVKGAYKESPKIAYQSRQETTLNYMKLMEMLFRNSKKFMIATHDSSMIRHSLELNRSYRREVTYAMLNGIRNKELARLASLGNRTSVYIPFGEKWLEYSIRRLRESSHLALVLRSLVVSQNL